MMASIAHISPAHSLGRATVLILIVTVARAVLIPLVLEIMRSYKDAQYASPECALALVNVTNPVHFANHWFFQRLKFDETACDVPKYLEAQYSTFDFNNFTQFSKGLVLSAFILLIYDAFYQKTVLSFRFPIVLLLGYQLAVLHHCFSHLGQDIFYMVGILHHADTSNYTGQSNITFVDTMPQGLGFYIPISVLWASCVRTLLVRADPSISRLLSGPSLYAACVFGGYAVAYQVKESHTNFHALATNAMEFSMPWSFEWTAYRHVFLHHLTGDSFGPHFLFDYVTDTMFRVFVFFYHDIFGASMNQRVMHEALVFAFDVFFGLIYAWLIWVVLRITAFVYFLIFNSATKDANSALMSVKLKGK